MLLLAVRVRGGADLHAGPLPLAGLGRSQRPLPPRRRTGEPHRYAPLRGRYTVKKENQVFLIYQEIQNGAVAKSYMRKGFLIYEEMRKYLTIYEEAVSYI